MRPALPILFTLAVVGGCTSIPSRCYVTLDNAGGPTAEACETGPELIVRPITPTNAAYCEYQQDCADLREVFASPRELCQVETKSVLLWRDGRRI